MDNRSRIILLIYPSYGEELVIFMSYNKLKAWAPFMRFVSIVHVSNNMGNSLGKHWVNFSVPGIEAMPMHNLGILYWSLDLTT